MTNINIFSCIFYFAIFRINLIHHQAFLVLAKFSKFRIFLKIRKYKKSLIMNPPIRNIARQKCTKLLYINIVIRINFSQKLINLKSDETNLVIAKFIDQGLMTKPLNVLHEVVGARVTGLALAGLLPVLWLSWVNSLENAQATKIGKSQLEPLARVFSRDVLRGLARHVLFLHTFLLAVNHSVFFQN